MIITTGGSPVKRPWATALRQVPSSGHWPKSGCAGTAPP